MSIVIYQVASVADAHRVMGDSAWFDTRIHNLGWYNPEYGVYNFEWFNILAAIEGVSGWGSPYLRFESFCAEEHLLRQ